MDPRESVGEALARLRREPRKGEPRKETTASVPATKSDAETPAPAHHAAPDEGPAASPATRSKAAAPEAPLPSWLKRRLATGEVHSDQPASAVGLRFDAPKSAEPLAGMQRVANIHGSYSMRETILPEAYRHGAWRLDAVDGSSAKDIASLAADRALQSIDLRRSIYLDVETTGLSGGAGTTSFLVALGRFEGSNFHLWQGFLEGPEEERAMLFEVAQRVADSECMVSFFGKSFDRHRLEDKMRMHHLEPPFAGRPHLDLYHPLQRLYKRSVPNGRLCTMERTLCAVEREDDLPGSFAPEAWFDYLGQRAHRMQAVFQHNADDVLSLVTLAAHLGRSREERDAEGGALSGSSAARALGWAQLHGKQTEPKAALHWLALALERAPQLLGDRALAFESGIWCRQLGQREEALERFERLAAGQRDELACRALVEAAKLHEHGRGGPRGWGAALEVVELARSIAAELQGGKALRLRAALEHRAARLTVKLKRKEA